MVYRSGEAARSHRILGLGVAALLLAFQLRRAPGGIARGVARLASLGYAVPGAVLVVGLLLPVGWLQRTWPQTAVGYWMTATVLGIVWAYLVRFVSVALQSVQSGYARIPASLDDSARMLGAGPARMFRTITLPATRYGLVSAAFVVFTIVITDFGNPMVIGGDYTVLATEIYNQVSGQGRMELGAVIGVVLLVPAAIAVVLEKVIMRGHHASITERSKPLALGRHRLRDSVALAYAIAVALAIALNFYNNHTTIDVDQADDLKG